MNYQLTTMAERPDLHPIAERLISDNWPPFLQEDQVAYEFWGRLYSDFPAYQQFLLSEDGETLIAVGNSIPLAWDEADEALSDEGWRWALAQGFADLGEQRPFRTLCALSITINPAFLGKGISKLMVQGMKENGRLHNLTRMVAPVRPNLKNRYPLIPMKEYVTWQNAAGLPYDAWLRVHYRLGARITAVCAKSMRIVGTVADWEKWTGLKLAQNGLYVVEGGLTPVKVSVEKNMGVYIEPNVWMVTEL